MANEDFLNSLIGMAVRSTIPIIDSHIHLFDTRRPGGVPWPEKHDTKLYRPALPKRYSQIVSQFGVVGAIAIEASPLASDNDWVLGVAADHPIIVGVVGNLVPGTSSFRKDLERLHSNPLFLGIRYGNLWGRNLAIDSVKSDFLSDLGILAQFGLVLDTASVDPCSDLVRTVVDIADHLPELRIVIDHLPHMRVPTELTARREYWSYLQHLATNPNIFVKFSEILVRSGKIIHKDPGFYNEKLDAIWEVFAEDHILFGSDWPNSDQIASYADTLAIVSDYVSRKGMRAFQKVFRENSIAAYKWHPRQAAQ